MPEPVPYRSPQTNPRANPSGGRTMRVGGGVCLCTIVPFLPPAIAPMGEYAKYFVAFGVAGMLLGLSCVINGFIDWMRGK